MLGRRSITTGIKPDGMHRMPLGLSQGFVTFTLGRRSITTGVKPDGMHRMPLGLSQGILTFMLGRRSITTGIKSDRMHLPICSIQRFQNGFDLNRGLEVDHWLTNIHFHLSLE